MKVHLFFVLTVVSLTWPVDAQDSRLDIKDLPGAAPYVGRLKKHTTSPQNDLQALRVQKPVRAAFIIDPLVHRVSAPRGKLMRFQFKMVANAKPTKLQISPVAMVQQESGSILPDRDAVPPGVLRVTNESEVDLALAEEHTIECEMRVPPVNSPFLSYGILVRELPTEETNKDPGQPQAAIGLRFVTQYLLRIDLTVQGVTGDSLNNIQIPEGRLTERFGNAMIQAYVVNPTDTSMSFTMRSQLVSRETGKRYRSNLGMQARAGAPVPDRYASRILGDTRLLMEGPLEESVFPGTYDLQLEVLYNGRVYGRKSFPVEIKSGDFPAQDATIVRVARDIAVEPSSIELSLRRGGKRLQSLTVENGSQQTVIAELTPKTYIGDLADWITFRPNRLELAPGRKRKVLVMLGSKRTFVTHNYAFAQLRVRPETGEAIGTQDIPIALLTNSEVSSDIKLGDLAWKIQSDRAGFEVPLKNMGGRHLPLAGKLTLRDQFGRGFSVEDGYGRWVLPGREDRLWFPFRQLPPPGTYEIIVEVDQGEGNTPLRLQENIQLKSPAERLSERPVDGNSQ